MNEIEHAPLPAQLRGLAHELRREQPPGDVLEGIHRRLNERKAPKIRWNRALAGTACMAAAAWMAVIVLAPSSPASGSDTLAGFVSVAGSERWRDAALGNAWLVSTELPHARLAAYGLPYDPSRAADTVRAQLLMHSSGDVLAVRVIQ